MKNIKLKYLLIVIICLLFSLPGCNSDSSKIETNISATTIQSTMQKNSSDSVSTESELPYHNPQNQLEKAINMATPYMQLNEQGIPNGVLYDLNNDNFPELIKDAESEIYMYAVYDLTEESPVRLGEFFEWEAMDNTNDCIIYKCYDKINDETIYLNEKNHYDTQYIDSTLLRIDLYNDHVDNYVVASKESYTENFKDYFYMFNNNGKISSGNDNGETIIQSISSSYEILDTFQVGMDEYDITKFNKYPTVSLNSIRNNDNITEENGCFVHINSVLMSRPIYDEYIKQGAAFINKYPELTSVYILDKEADISFLSDNKTIQMLRISVFDNLKTSVVIGEMTQLRYLYYYNYDSSRPFLSLEFLKKNKKLEVLHLGNGLETTAIDAYQMLYSLPNLKVIIFYRGSNATQIQIDDIKNNMPNCVIAFL